MNQLRHNLRTVVEVAVIAMLCSVVIAIAQRSAFTIHRTTIAGTWRGLSLILIWYLFMLVQWVGPLAAGYFYGWKRQRQFTFFTALLGWTIGFLVTHLLVSAIWSALGLSSISTPHNTKTPVHHVPVWLSWTMWLVWYAIFSILPSLAVMKGQKRRMVHIPFGRIRIKLPAKG